MNKRRRRQPVRLVHVLVALLVMSSMLIAARGGVAAQDKVELSIWSYLPPDDAAVKAYIAEFEKQNPDIKIKYTAYPEDDYQDKVRTTLSAKNPPDVAVIEDRRWMKAGFVVELTQQYAAWGVNPADFAPGGMARTAPEGRIENGIYGVGDFLGGNVLVYNKKMFDEAGVPYPSDTQSMTWTQYGDICRKLGKPDRNPGKAIYGCSVPATGFDIYGGWVWGQDGRLATGNMNSAARISAWNVGTALVRDKFAPSAELLSAFPAGESDAFAQGKMAITWSDFTEVSKYLANNIDFGMAPYMVLDGAGTYVDTWTTPWGTFKDSKHPEQALRFLKFIATDAQRLRASISADPPLSTKVATELEWGAGDPIKMQYLTVLQAGGIPQIFVPPLPEGAYQATEIYRKMTTAKQEDAKPLLDEAVAKAQPALDKAWQDWEKLGTG